MWAILLTGVAAVATFPAMMVYPNQYDSCIFLWMGRRMWAGDLPYRDLWDNKLPILYWVNAAAAALGSPRLSIYALQSLAVAAGGILLYGIGRRLFDEWPARLGGLAYVTFGATTVTLMTGNLTEPWAAPFVILCIWAMLRHAEGRRSWPWAMLSGLGMGIAVGFRAPALLLGAALLPLLGLLWRRRRVSVSAVLAWLVGFALAPASMAAWAAHVGVLEPMLDQCVWFNLAYGTTAARPEWATWGELARRFGRLVDDTWPWHLPAAAGLVVLFRPSGVGRPTVGPLPAGRLGRNLTRAVVVVWLLAAGASALPSLRFYNHHYYLTLAPLSLLIGALWQPLLGGPSRASPHQPPAPARLRRRRVVGWLLAGLLALAVGRHFQQRIDDGLRVARWAAPARRAADYLQRECRPDQSIFVFSWGPESDVLARLGRPCPTRHVMVIFYPELHAADRMLAQWRDEMLADPPDWLLCHRDHDLVTGKWYESFGWRRPAVRRHLLQLHAAYRDLYEPADGFEPGRLVLYRKKPGWQIASP